MAEKTEVAVFISSPGDVAPERERAGVVLKRLNEEFDHIELKPILWEERFYRAHDDFQGQIKEAKDCDLVVCVVWSRLGTPLPELDRYKKKDGSFFGSGTEYEFETALEHRRETGRVPDLVMFRKLAEAKIGIDDWSKAALANQQLSALRYFWEKWFHNEDGHFTTAFNTFRETDEFEDMFEAFVRQWLDDEGLLTQEVTWPEAKGSPFRGLEVFEEEHAPIFFGRNRAVDWLRARLMASAARGCGFLLVLGMSGVGKSSLIRAGLIPKLKRRGAVAGVDLWRRCIIRPDPGRDDPFEVLAEGLLATDVLPELLEGDYRTVQQLADLFRTNATGGGKPQNAALPIANALRRAAETEAERRHSRRPLQARLILIVDQFEELFTYPEDMQDGFADLLAAFASDVGENAAIWVVATMRSDFYPSLQARPKLIELKERGAQFDLEPPESNDLEQIITGPAKAAGLEFESRDRRSLAEVLEAEAAKESGALPLLEFTLDELYKRRDTENNLLTYKAYDDLGGLAGAIGTRAEAVYNQLSEGMQAAFPAVMRGLVRVDRAGNITARIPRWDALCRTEAQRGVVERYVAERLFVTYGDESSSERSVRVAHESLLRHWDRSRRQIEQDRGDIELREDLQDEARKWRDAEAGDKAGYLLPSGKRLADAVDLVQRRRDELDKVIIDYVQACEDAAERSERRKRQWAMGVGVGGLVLAAVAGWFAVQSDQNAAEAVKAREIADERRALAEELRDAMTDTANHLSRRMAATVNDLVDEGQYDQALTLALDALPGADEVERFGLKVVPEARVALERAVTALPAFSFAHQGWINDIAYSPDGKLILTTAEDNTTRVWDAVTGVELNRFDHDADGVRARFTRDGRYVITLSADYSTDEYDEATYGIGRADMWDIADRDGAASPVLTIAGLVSPDQAAFDPNGRWIAGIETETRYVTAYQRFGRGGSEVQLDHGDLEVGFLALDPQDELIVTGMQGGIAHVWDMETGRKLFELAHQSDLYDGAFSANGRYLVTTTWDDELVIWDITTGAKVASLNDDYWVSGIYNVEVSDDGQRVLVRLDSTTAYIWDVAHGTGPGITIEHNETINNAHLSPSGAYVATAATDGFGALWDARTGALLWGLDHGEGTDVTEIRFSPDERYVVTVTENYDSYVYTADVWDVATGNHVFEVNSHTDIVYDVDIDPTGRYLLTSSADWDADLWDIETGDWLRTISHDGGVWYGRFTHNGDGMMTMAAEGDIITRFWPIDGGEPTELDRIPSAERVDIGARGETVATVSLETTSRAFVVGLEDSARRPLYDQDQEVYELAFSADGRHVAIAAADGAVRIVHVESGDEVGILEHGASVAAARFSPDGSVLATIDLDGLLKTWDAETGQARLSLETTAYFYDADDVHLEFLPGGRTVIVNSAEDYYVEIWDLEQEYQVFSLDHDGLVQSVRASADGKWLVTTAGDDLARLWSLSSGSVVKTFRHAQIVDAILSNDGSQIVTVANAEGRGEARVWDVSTAVETTVAEHDALVNDAAFARETGSLIAGLDDGSARIWSLNGAAEELALEVGGSIAAVGLDANGETALTVSSDGDYPQVMIDLATGEQNTALAFDREVYRNFFDAAGDRLATIFWTGPASLTRLDRPDQPVELALPDGIDDFASAAFSADGRWLMMNGVSSTLVQVWDAGTGAPLWTLDHGAIVMQAEFDPLRPLLMTSGEDDFARLWSMETGEEVGAYSAPDADGLLIAAWFTPDGKYVFGEYDDEVLRMWNAADGGRIGAAIPHQPSRMPIAFSADGGRMATAPSFGVLAIHATEGPTPLLEIDVGEEFTAARFAADGETIWVTTENSGPRAFDLQTGQARSFSVDPGEVYLVEFAPNGGALAVEFFGESTDYESVVKVFDTATLESRAVPVVGTLNRLTFDPAGARMLLGTTQTHYVLKSWDARSGAPGIAASDEEEIVSAALSPDGRLALTYSWDMPIKIWDMEEGRLMHRLEHDDWVNSVEFSPDGQRIVSASDDWSVRVWDAATGTVLSQIDVGDFANSAAFDPDSRRVVVVTSGGAARIWDTETGEERVLGDATEQTEQSTARFDPTGNRVVTIGWDGDAASWDVASGEKLFALIDGDLFDVDFDAGGRFIFGMSSAGMRVWDAKSGVEIASLPHDGLVLASVFQPDSQSIATLTENAVVRDWQLPLTFSGDEDFGDVRLYAEARQSRRLTAAEARDIGVRDRRPARGRPGTGEEAPAETVPAAAPTGPPAGTGGGRPQAAGIPGEAPDEPAAADDEPATDVETQDAERGAPRGDGRGEERAVADPVVAAQQSCDRLVAHPYDPGRKARVAGRVWSDITQAEADRAIKDCELAAAAMSPGTAERGRYLYQLARAHFRLADLGALSVDIYDRAAAASVDDPECGYARVYHQTAFEAMMEAARADYPMAYFSLGHMYANCRGVTRDYDLAIQSYEQAIERGVDHAAQELGEMYWDGLGVGRDRDRALSMWLDNAQDGNVFSHRALAEAFDEGVGVERDLERAFFHHAVAARLFEQAQSLREAEFHLARRSALAHALDIPVAARVFQVAKGWANGEPLFE